MSASTASITNPLIVVYSPGKAGTKTVMRSLQAHLPDTPIVDVRSMYQDVLAEYYDWVTVRPTDRALRVADPEIAQAIRDNPSRDVWLISLIREPVAAAVSSYFWNYSLRHVNPDPSSVPVAHLRDEIVRGEFASRPDFFTGWLDRELYRFTGIDAYSTEFSREKGYAYFKKDRFTALVIRVEDLDRVFAAAFRGLGIALGGLAPAEHRAVDQTYAATYRRFKQSARFPRYWLDGQLSSRFAVHFYHSDELSAVRDYWLDEH